MGDPHSPLRSVPHSNTVWGSPAHGLSHLSRWTCFFCWMMIQAGDLCRGSRWGLSGDTWPSQPETLLQSLWGSRGASPSRPLPCPVLFHLLGVTFHSGKRSSILARVTDRAGLGCPGNAEASLSHTALLLLQRHGQGVILVHPSLRTSVVGAG